MPPNPTSRRSILILSSHLSLLDLVTRMIFDEENLVTVPTAMSRPPYVFCEVKSVRLSVGTLRMHGVVALIFTLALCRSEWPAYAPAALRLEVRALSTE